VKYNEPVELEMFDKLFPERKFSAMFWRSGNEPFAIKDNERLFDAVKESADESEIGDEKYSFDVEFIRTEATDEFKFKFIAKHQALNLPATKAIVNLENGEEVKLPIEIYYGKLQFPFVLYNKEKAKRYSSYKTKEKIFQSTYDFVIVPIKLTGDSLTYDLFLNYSKLNLGDGISRWTPIKKRITIARDWAFAEIKLPKENWSANFTRGGERYDIYGFSDVESYIDESVRIKFKLLRKETQ
jgi:hypothetical protein